MKQFLPSRPRRRAFRAFLRKMPWALCLASPLLVSAADFKGVPKLPQKQKTPGSPMKSVSQDLWEGYLQVGDSRIYARPSSCIDLWGEFRGLYYGSTYNNGGYVVAMEINGDYLTLDCSQPGDIYGVAFKADVLQQGDLARVCYTLTNNNEQSVEFSLGVYADVQIGDNDSAPISRRIDQGGNTYGLTMRDGYEAELCILFGAGLSGVTPVDDFWFGNYGYNSGAWNITGHYDTSDNFMVENGNYDSAMGWCWKQRHIAPGETMEFSYLMGVGDVNLQPGASIGVTPDDPDNWNDIALPHTLTVEGEYLSPAGLDGRIEYSVESLDDWRPLTEMMPSHTKFSSELTAYFNPGNKVHTINFRIVDNVGNISMLEPIEYLDIAYVEFSGIEDRVYNGEPQVLDIHSSEISGDWFNVSDYSEYSTNAGEVSFTIDGVYPNTIGRQYSSFRIIPKQIEGSIVIATTDYDFCGYDIAPEYTLEGEVATLSHVDRWDNGDYILSYADNHYAGTGYITIEGVNNYQGTISASFTIHKTAFPEEQINYYIPEPDITYDGMAHEAAVYDIDGAGEKIITYVNGKGESSSEAPVAAGDYEVYLEFKEGPGLYEWPRRKIGSFSIFNLDAGDWEALQSLYEELSVSNDKEVLWPVTSDPASAAHLQGLTIKEGKIKMLNLAGSSLKGELPLSAFRFKNVESVSFSYNDLTGNIDNIASIKESDPDAFKGIREVYLNSNHIKGNAGVFSLFPDLEYLDAGNNEISEVYPMIDPLVSVNIFSQTLDRTIDLDLRDFDFESFAEKIPSVALYNHAEQRYDAEMLYAQLNDGKDWDLTIMQDNGRIYGYSNGLEAYHGVSGDTCRLNLQPNDIRMNVKLSFDRGDADFNGAVDVLDLQSIVNEILCNRGDWRYATPFNFTAANLFEDEIINVQDAVCLVNLLLSEVPAEERNPVAENRKEDSAEASVWLDGGSLMIHSDSEIAAFDVTVEGKDINVDNIPGMLISKRAYGDKTRIIGYSISGATLAAGVNRLGSSDAVSVSRARLSGMSAREIPVVLNNSLSGISGVGHHDGISVSSLGITVGGLVDAGARWRIMTVSGIVLAEGEAESGSGSLFIPFSPVSGEVYLLVIYGNSESHTYKITLK